MRLRASRLTEGFSSGFGGQPLARAIVALEDRKMDGRPPFENELEMVKRHVREAEQHIARQIEIIASLAPGTEIAGTAWGLLAEFEKTLALHLAHLAKIEARPSDAGELAI